MPEDVMRKREYVREIRRSFDAAEENDTMDEAWQMKREEEEPGTAWIFFKIRLLAAIALFLGFLFLQYGQVTVYGYAAEDIRQLSLEQEFDGSGLMEKAAKLFTE